METAIVILTLIGIPFLLVCAAGAGAHYTAQKRIYDEAIQEALDVAKAAEKRAKKAQREIAKIHLALTHPGN